jgi:hypothetical protein
VATFKLLKSVLSFTASSTRVWRKRKRPALSSCTENYFGLRHRYRLFRLSVCSGGGNSSPLSFSTLGGRCFPAGPSLEPGEIELSLLLTFIIVDRNWPVQKRAIVDRLVTTSMQRRDLIPLQRSQDRSAHFVTQTDATVAKDRCCVPYILRNLSLFTVQKVGFNEILA